MLLLTLLQTTSIQKGGLSLSLSLQKELLLDLPKAGQEGRIFVALRVRNQILQDVMQDVIHSTHPSVEGGRNVWVNCLNMCLLTTHSLGRVEKPEGSACSNPGESLGKEGFLDST